ncbi:hypothetical protein CEP52_012325 [Fusarium oligoseptatum]|uniref:Mid2 domain-containing protein n=1 Tax=Fusarium oligoseptatum TaxID=2604345 RepID=A0A428SYU7_9HYPO|nr:hypothetical protein CEP52_012325 [Fusarium oligoseptatum]
MMRSFLQFGPFLLAAACVHSETVFQRPPGPGPNRDYRDDPIYELGQEIDLIWEMDFEEASIVIWQQDINKVFGDKSYYAEVIQNTKSTRYTWKVTYDGFPVDHDPKLSNVYFFQLFDTTGNATPITCHYFNITDPKTTSTSSAATTSTTTTASKTFTTRTPSVTAEKVAATSQVEEDGEKGLSNGAITGIAVGAGIGGIVLSGLGFLLWRRFRGGGGPNTPRSPDDDKEVVSVSSPSVDPYHHPGHQSYYQPQTQEEPEQPRERQIGGLHEAPTERYT